MSLRVGGGVTNGFSCFILKQVTVLITSGELSAAHSLTCAGNFSIKFPSFKRGTPTPAPVLVLGQYRLCRVSVDRKGWHVSVRNREAGHVMEGANRQPFFHSMNWGSFVPTSDLSLLMCALGYSIATLLKGKALDRSISITCKLLEMQVPRTHYELSDLNLWVGMVIWF